MRKISCLEAFRPAFDSHFLYTLLQPSWKTISIPHAARMALLLRHGKFALH